MELPLDLSIRKSLSPAISDTSTETGNENTDTEDTIPISPSLIVLQDICPDVQRRHGDISVSLVDAHVWDAFRRKGTEMIINRCGRRMFPHVSVTISGLSPSGLYNIWLEIVPADGKRYKYIRNEWMSVSHADPSPSAPPYLHPDSPNTGAFWTMKKISFAKLKLTNSRDSAEGNILLQSMHKYKARIRISEAANDRGSDAVTADFNFDETTFIAVTAYQNENITKMKIHNNPFAKAFRDKHLSIKHLSNGKTPSTAEEGKGQTRRKRKHSEIKASPDETAYLHPSVHLTPSSAMASASPWGLGALASPAPYLPPICTMTTGLPPVYRPFSQMNQQPFWSASPFMFQETCLVSSSRPSSHALCSTTSSLPYYRSTARCENSLP